jgi:hypothetical protein
VADSRLPGCRLTDRDRLILAANGFLSSSRLEPKRSPAKIVPVPPGAGLPHRHRTLLFRPRRPSRHPAGRHGRAMAKNKNENDIRLAPHRLFPRNFVVGFYVQEDCFQTVDSCCPQPTGTTAQWGRSWAIPVELVCNSVWRKTRTPAASEDR